MRAILESYDSELAPTEYSPQLSKRLREAEDILQKTQSHHAEIEVDLQICNMKKHLTLSDCNLHTNTESTRLNFHRSLLLSSLPVE